MKKCTTCKQIKEISEFNVNRKRNDGLQTKCRDCSKTHARGYYEENKARMRRQIHAASKQRRKGNLSRVREWKEEHGCSSCPERTPIALDFHHPDDNKEFSIARAVSQGMSWTRLVDEIQKCVILCANCHRKLHDTEFLPRELNGQASGS